MHELLRDPDLISGVVRRRVLRAMVPAVKKLGRVARGHDRFAHDHERAACLALARLAPHALSCAAARDAIGEEDEEWAAQWLTPEKLALLEKLQQPQTREEVGEEWAQSFLQGSGMPAAIDTLEKAREYGRQQWDECEAAGPGVEKVVRRARRQDRQDRQRRRR